MTIPKIIHQTWKTDKIPDKVKKYQESWKTFHPNWEYMLWTDKDNENLIKEHYPWFLDIYENYEYNIQRVDAVRPFILYHYGGMYVDLDYECYKTFDDVVNLYSDKVYIVESPWPGEKVQNSLMISPKGNPFWKVVIKNMIKNKNLKFSGKVETVLKTTGPNLIEHSVKEHPVELLDSKKFNPSAVVNNCSGCYANHFGTSTWVSTNDTVHVACTFFHRYLLVPIVLFFLFYLYNKKVRVIHHITR